MNIFHEGSKAHTTFKFYFKIKNDEEIIKDRIDITTDHKKVRVNGFKQVNSKLIAFLESESYHIEKKVKGNKSY